MLTKLIDYHTKDVAKEKTKMNQTRGQGQACRDIGGCIIQISYRQDSINGRYIATGTRPCMRCMNNVRVVVND